MALTFLNHLCISIVYRWKSGEGTHGLDFEKTDLVPNSSADLTCNCATSFSLQTLFPALGLRKQEVGLTLFHESPFAVC